MECLEVIGATKYRVTLEEDIRDFKVPRKFSSNTYGGNMRETFPMSFSKVCKSARHGKVFISQPSRPPVAGPTTPRRSWPVLRHRARLYQRLYTPDCFYESRYEVGVLMATNGLVRAFSFLSIGRGGMGLSRAQGNITRQTWIFIVYLTLTGSPYMGKECGHQTMGC